METLSASIVGAGTAGFLSLTALAASPHYRIAAVADSRPEALAKVRSELPEVALFSSYEAMFAAQPTDVVCVCTYADSHARITRDALNAPSLRGLLLEKPLAPSVQQARLLLAEIRGRSIPVAVPHGLVARRTPLEVMERVRRGDIGDLELVEVQCTGWDILNAGIHWVHFFITLTSGDPVKGVMALCDTSRPTHRDGLKVETSAITVAETQSGVRLMMLTGNEVAISRPGKGLLYRLIGTGGSIEFYGWERPYRILNAEHPCGALVEPEELQSNGHQKHLEDLADCVRAGRPDIGPVERSLAALEVCEAAIASSRVRAWIPLPMGAPPAPTGPDWEIGQPYAGEPFAIDGRQR